MGGFTMANKIPKVLYYGATSSSVTFTAGVKVTGFGARADGKWSDTPGGGGEVKTLDYQHNFSDFGTGDVMSIDPRTVARGVITFWLEASIKIQEKRSWTQTAYVDYDGNFRYEWPFEYHFVAKGGPRVDDLVILNPEYDGSEKYEKGKQAVRLAWVRSTWADGRQPKEPDKYVEVLPAFSLPGLRGWVDAKAGQIHTDGDTTFIRPWETGYKTSLGSSTVQTFGEFMLYIRVPEPPALSPEQQENYDRFNGKGKWQPQPTLPADYKSQARPQAKPVKR